MKMTSHEKDFFEASEEKLENEYMVTGMNKTDYFLLVGIGILPFVIASIWYNIVF